ncbi:MAG TPA: hypothetical protein VM734_26765 [Kofleriaceae bacterium]|jgi:uncharacterized delta-60 repeat protein|nr:hypothetical protein [Kofleriaceae bacterium]
MNTTWNKIVGAGLAAFAFTACGDNSDGDGNNNPDASSPDAAAVDAAPPVDAPIDAPADFTPPTPVAVVLSAAGEDQLQSAVAAPGGGFYAAGFAAATVGGAKVVTVVKLTAAGALDTTWGGGDGIAPTPLTFTGANDEIDLALQGNKIIVSATIANDTTPADNDWGVTRLNADGTVDTTFGGSNTGVRRINLSTSTANNNRDGVRAVAVGPTGLIYLHGLARAEDPRTDTDFILIRLTNDGADDASFAKHVLDIQNSNATPRGIHVFANGSVVAGGYANSEGVGSTQPVLYRVNDDGTRDNNFAGGLFHAAVLQVQTEVYGFAVHGDKLVTGGYGRDSGTQNDWVSMRFDAATGVRDTTWGGAANGAVLFDVSGTMVGDNCRGSYALPNGKTLLVGSTGSGAPGQDAAYAILNATGGFDTAYGDGVHTTPFGANGADQIWGAAVSGNTALMVGYKGASPQSAETNDDAFAIVLPLQ